MMKRKIIKILFVTVAISTISVFSILADDGWQQAEDGQWSYIKDDKKITNRWITDDGGNKKFVNNESVLVTSNWVNYQNERYYVNEEGICLENQWFSITSTPTQPHIKATTTWYYAGEEGKIYRNGWYTINGGQYYFNNGGAAPRDAVATVEGKKYYIKAETGLEHSGWFCIESTDSKGNPVYTWRYAAEDGVLLTGDSTDLSQGFKTLDNETYYFDANGTNYRKRWFTVNDIKYYADEEGIVRQPGWFSISGVNGQGVGYTNWYYVSNDGSMLQNGFHEIDGKTYYFDVNGVNYRKRWLVSAEKYRWYFNEDGEMMVDTWFNLSTVNANTGVTTDHWYYAGSDGQVLRDGLYEVNGKHYYFDINGNMAQKRWLTDKKKRRMYADEDGVVAVSDWFSISGVNSVNEPYTYWYYADETGYILTDNVYTINGKEYLFNANGIMFTGFKKSSAGTYTHYDETTGEKSYGWQWIHIPASWQNGEAAGNYIKYYGKDAYFYFDPDTGNMYASTAGTYSEVTIDGRKYCVDKLGIIQRGWAKLRDATPEITGYGYYMPKAQDGLLQGERAANIWVKTQGAQTITGDLSETWYYFDENGLTPRGSKGKLAFKEIDGYLYAFNFFGRTVSGFVESRNKDIYYFDVNNRNAAATGQTQADDGTGMTDYLFDSSGKAVTGISGGKLYYKGKIQKADAGEQYAVIRFANEENSNRDRFYLVDNYGTVIKARTVTDTAGNEITSDNNGLVSGKAGIARTAAGPAATTWDDESDI